ncbi:hypothetical protein D3C72_2204770 [compost metagenome]
MPRRVRGEEGDDIGHIAALARLAAGDRDIALRPFDRDFGRLGVPLVGIVVDLGIDGPRTHRIDPDPVLAQLKR